MKIPGVYAVVLLLGISGLAAVRAVSGQGAAPRATTNQQINANNALYMAVIKNDSNGCAKAIREGAQPNSISRGEPILQTAAKSGLAATKCLVENGADVNAVSTYAGQDRTAAWAAIIGTITPHFDILAYLIERGANPNAVLRTGDRSLLMFSVEHGDLSIVKVLVEHGADVNYVWQYNHRQRTPLTRAKEAQKGDIIEYLEAHGAHEPANNR